MVCRRVGGDHLRGVVGLKDPPGRRAEGTAAQVRVDAARLTGLLDKLLDVLVVQVENETLLVEGGRTGRKNLHGWICDC